MRPTGTLQPADRRTDDLCSRGRGPAEQLVKRSGRSKTRHPDVPDLTLAQSGASRLSGLACDRVSDPELITNVAKC